MSVSKQIELAVRLKEEKGELSRLLAIVASAGVHVLACCTYHDRDCGVMLLVTDNPEKTGHALRAAGVRFRTGTVVLVSAAYEPVLAAHLARLLAGARIGLMCSYVSWEENACAYIVLKTNDDDRAVRLLSADALIHDVARQKRVSRQSLLEREVA